MRESSWTSALTRREWLLLTTATACSPGLPNSRDLVGTPEKRAAYLEQMLHALCTELGPRPGWSQAYRDGARIVQREMERALPRVFLDTFNMTGWELTAEPQLRVDGTYLEVIPAHSGPGTPEEGFTGVVELTGEQPGRFVLVHQPGEQTLARFTAGPFGPPATTRYRGDDGIPRFSVHRDAIPLFEKAAAGQLPVFLKAPVREIPGCETSSVVGTLPGDSADEILYVAHLDTVYNSPGASDNTASAIAMVMLAHAMSGTRPARTFTFVATTGEETGYLGAKHYAQLRRDAGTLGSIKICINLDSLTYGPNLQIYTTDPELRQMVLDIHREVETLSEPRTFDRDDTMDSSPFRAAGARTLYFNSRGHDERTLPLNHRPEDTADTIDPSLIESSY